MATLATARKLLDRLAAFPTVSRDTNLPLIDWVEDWLDGQGIAAHRVWNADRTKAALYAQAGPEVAGGVVLSGHSDVVPVDGQAWTSDPWTVTERDGRLYGRGTCDMKGFVALSLAALPLALAAGVKRPLQIAISFDEELGCTGGPPLVAALREGLPAAAAVIVGEPSRMRVVTGHKGSVGWNVRVRGHEVHSSLLPEGISAVMEAARFLAWVNERNDALQALPRPSSGFVPPFTTLHAGQIAGGTANNITAADCWFNLEVRSLPAESLPDWAKTVEGVGARLSAALDARVAGTGIDTQRHFEVPALAPEAGGAAEALARRLTGDNGVNVVSYGTEAGQFQQGGYSCVVCGPGDIAQAHQPDEYLEMSEFQAGWRFMERLVAELAG